MADAVRSDNSNSNCSTSSSRSTSTAATSSAARNARYDATDCTVSIIFGQRGRQRQRHHQHRHSRSRSSVARSSSQNSVRRGRNSDGERAPESGSGVESLRQLEQPESASVANTGYFNGQAPRLLRDMSAPTEVEFSDAVCQLLTGQSSYNINSEAHMTRSVSLDLLSDSGSISFTDEVDEEASTDLPLMDYEVESRVDREPGQNEGQSSDEASSTHRGAPSTVTDCSALPDSSTLAEIFRCFICLGKVVDAQVCPCCSKLVCLPCIKRWLTDQKSECPHCRSPLLVSQLVSCRFISEISTEVEKMQGKLGQGAMEKLCPTHESPLSYFCTSCSVAVCSDCAILDEEHKGHAFERLSVTYGRHKKKIRMEAAGLRRRRKELSKLIASVDKNIEAVLKGKDESASELYFAFKRMQARLEEQLKCKLLALLAQKGSMTQEVDLLDTILTELEQQLNTIPKSDLIAQEPNISRMLQDIHTRTISDVSRTPVSAEFTSEVVPTYEYGELILTNYKLNIEKTQPTVFLSTSSQNVNEPTDFTRDVVYSEILQSIGVTWRLKSLWSLTLASQEKTFARHFTPFENVYPSGSESSQGTYLSVFMEMVDGGSEPATYDYGIEMLHRTKPHQRVIRKFSSDFEAGACWGYYQFYRIDLLEKEGYLLPQEDTLTLRFYVRPLTFSQQNQDLQRVLARMQLERDTANEQVALLRRAFTATVVQRRRRRATRVREFQGGVPRAVAGVVTSNLLKTGTKSLTVTRQQHQRKQDSSCKKSSKCAQEMWSQGGSRCRSATNSDIRNILRMGDARRRDVISDWERFARFGKEFQGVAVDLEPAEADPCGTGYREDGEVTAADGYKQALTEESRRSADGTEGQLSRQVHLQLGESRSATKKHCESRRQTCASTSSKLSDEEKVLAASTEKAPTVESFTMSCECKKGSSLGELLPGDEYPQLSDRLDDSYPGANHLDIIA